MQNTVGSIFEKREERRYDSNMKIGLGEELCGSGSGYCQVARCGLFGYLGCATREVVSNILGEWVVKMGGGCTWVRILSSGAMWLVWVSGLCYQRGGQ